MFYILSKTIYILLMPITWVLGLLTLGFMIPHKNKKRAFTFSGIALFYLLSNSVITNEAMLLWELPPTPLEEMQSTYEVGIVLSGLVNNHKSPDDRVYLNKGADRVVHAAMLYQKGIIKKILVTGSYTKITGESKSEAKKMKELLLMFHIPEKDILMEEVARNTRENATYSAEILNELYPQEEHLLITSAFHMRRAKGCFEKAGLTVATFSTDFYTSDRNINPFSLLVPSAGSFRTSGVLIHEVVGYVVYQLMGYV